MIQIDKSLINTPVYVFKTDDYDKFGILISIDESYITLRYFSGREIMILREDIRNIRPYKTQVR